MLTASIAADVFERAVQPTLRVAPSAAVDRRLANDRGALDLSMTPYLIEPLDRFADRTYQGIVFVGPARTGKTFGLALGGIGYAVTVAPADILCTYMSQDAARDFSRMDLDRVLENTPELAALLSPRSRDNNTYDKFFRNGVALKIGWPASTQLRGKTNRYVVLMDYDGGAINVDKRGSMWGQGRKRIETYMSRGKCLAESSPGFEYDDPDWKPATPHEGPPARGIMAIYNTGTRARWFWPCQHCDQHFQARPGIEAFLVPELAEVEEALKVRDPMSLAASWAQVACPHCGGIHAPEHRSALNTIRRDGELVRGATWLHEGQTLVDGRLEGEPRATDIASYWLGGCAAAYQPWVGLVHTYLTAVTTWLRTGDESDMRRSSLEDQAWPYLPMAVRRRTSTDQYADRKEHWERGTIPQGVRFLIAVVDVQKHRFVVQVHGFGVGLESWLVDRFTIFASERRESDGRIAPLNPAAFGEDWAVLEELVIERRYRYVLPDGELELEPLVTFCDSGGADGVTDKAYEFWRTQRKQGRGRQFRLVKGVGNLNAPRAAKTFPDARARKDRSAGRGDVPVWLLNVNMIKDGVFGDLARKVPGPGYVHVPDWIDPEYFAELAAETRTARGWEANGPNEAADLHTYARAACFVLGAEGIHWERPPPWAVALEERAAQAKLRAPASAIPPPAAPVQKQNPFARRDGRGFRR